MCLEDEAVPKSMVLNGAYFVIFDWYDIQTGSTSADLIANEDEFINNDTSMRLLVSWAIY